VSPRPAFRLAGLGLALLCAGVPAAGRAPAGPSGQRAPFTADELIQAVARAQRRADLAVTASTFDQVEVRTDYGRDGTPKAIRRRRYEYFSGDRPDRATRALVEVDGRPPTEEEMREEAEDDARMRRRRAERLSDLIARFSYGPVEEVRVEGRPAYALDFAPKAGLRATTLGDRALNALAGRVIVDAADTQVVSVEARLVAPVKVAMGLGASVKHATISYRAQRLPEGAWLPCVVALRLTGQKAVLFRLDTSFRFEFSGYARTSVEVETEVGTRRGPSVQSAP
jgi:hypothetical protein